MTDDPSPDLPPDPRTIEAELEEQRGRAHRVRQELRRHDQRWRSHVAELKDAHRWAQETASRDRDELLTTLEALEAAATSILSSRRWHLANRLGDLRDRLGRGRTPGKEEARLRDALQRARALRTPESGDRSTDGSGVPDDGSLPGATAPPEAPTGGEPIRIRAHFSDLDGYLRTALTNPVLPAPYDEPARRVIGVMDSLRRAALIAAREDPELETTLVSVVLPIMQDGPDVDAAIERVVAQSHPAWELLLVGAGAAASTERWSTRDERIHHVTAAREITDPWLARSVGLAAAEGTYVAHLDTRTTWHADLLCVLIHELRQRDGAGVAYAAQELVAQQVEAGPPLLVGLRFGPYHRPLLENRGTIGLSTVVHERGLLEARMTAFDPNLADLACRDLLLDLTARTDVAAVPCLLSTTDVTGIDPHVELVGHADLASRSAEPGEADPALLGLDAQQMGVPLEVSGLDVLVRDRPPPRALPPALRRAGTRRSTTVVIPSYHAANYLDVCLTALITFSPLDHTRIVIVDNASDAATWQVIDRHAEQPAITVIANERNLGFTHAANQGIEAAGESDVVLLNNDALVTPGWLDAMWAALDEVPRTGLVVPRQVLSPGDKAARSHVPCADIDREVDANLSILHGNVEVADPTLPTGYHPVTFAPFFCAYLPRTTIDRIGALNVEHGPHYRSDRLYCETVRHGAGLRVIYTQASKVYHFRRRATRTLRKRDPALYEAMYVDNDWAAITRGGSGAPI